VAGAQGAAVVSRELQIGDRLYNVQPLTAMRSFVLQPRLAPVVAEAAALFFGVARGVAGGDTEISVAALLEADVDLDKLVQAFGRIAEKLPPRELEDITRQLLAGATCNEQLLFAAVQGAGDPFDVLMRGRALETWRLLWHAVRVNYPDFFAALAGSAAPAPAASPSAA